MEAPAAGPPVGEVVTTAARLHQLGAAWEALARRDPDARIFQGYAWLSTWLRYHPHAQPAIFTTWRGERLTAALPLCVHVVGRPPLRLRLLRFASDNDCDYCDALADPHHPRDLADLWSALLQRRDWHLLDLRHVRAGSHLASLLATPPAHLRIERQHQEIAPYLDLRFDWQETVARGQRPELLRRRRRLGERGTVTFDVASCPSEVDQMLAQLAALHTTRWQSRQETSVFRFPAYREWLRELCHRLLARGELYLCRLALDNDPVSLGLYFLCGHRLLCYTSTFNDAYSKFGPVHLLLLAVIEDARGRGLACVHDFGRGGEDYKLRWTHDAEPLERLLIARRTLAGRAAFWWAARVKTLCWRHHRLGTALRELRRRLALCREGQP